MINAIKIKDILESSRYRVFNISKNVSLEEQLLCPACGSQLKTLCLFVSESKNKKLRYGLCESCGYMGYIDRPERSWMIEYYNKNWDTAAPMSKTEILHRSILPGKGVKPSEHIAASLIDKMGLDKNRAICEIGSGYGGVLKYFRTLGFENLIGIENSKHRADLVRSVLGLNIIHGDFGGTAVQEQLSRFRPLGLVFSHHTLEHVYDPQNVLKKISDLQNDGDFLILALPNSAGEHINHSLFFLPHLHSFSKKALERLLNRNGYEILSDSSPNDKNIIFAAQKTQNPRVIFQDSGENYYNVALARINNGLAINSIGNNGLNRLFWEWYFDESTSASKFSNGYLSKITWQLEKLEARIKTRLKRFASGCTMLVVSEENRGNTFEIRFDGDIKLLIK